jgi:hypothetical protein
LALLPDLLEETKLEAAFLKLQEMIAKGDAQLVSTLVVKLRDGEKAEAQSVEEFRYPTEFDPPRLPQNVPLDAAILKDWPVTGITPTAFETRNLGTSVEVEASTADGQRINIRCIPQHVRFLRWAKTDAGKLANGERLSVEMPIIHSMKNTNSLVLRNGQRVLLGVHKLPEPLDGLELSFLRVTAMAASAK